MRPPGALLASAGSTLRPKDWSGSLRNVPNGSCSRNELQPSPKWISAHPPLNSPNAAAPAPPRFTPPPVSGAVRSNPQTSASVLSFSAFPHRSPTHRQRISGVRRSGATDLVHIACCIVSRRAAKGSRPWWLKPTSISSRRCGFE